MPAAATPSEGTVAQNTLRTMTDMDDTADTASPPDTTTGLRVEREGIRRYVGLSDRGARVEIGSEGEDGVFTPGELLKIALAACAAMSSDFTLSRRLGDDYQATVRVSGDADRDEERYPRLHETYHLDLTGLDQAMAERVLDGVRRSVEATCTVGRTLRAGADFELGFETS